MKDFKLDSRPNIKSGFIAPDAYFESLADRVMLNLSLKEVKVVPLYKRRPVWVTSAAAAFVLSFSLLFIEKEASAPVMPDAKAIEDYLVYQSDISSYELQKNLDKQDLNELQKSINVSPEAIEEYLSNEDVYLYE
ncbi:hypothetical protein [Flavobacterium sp. NRK1]|jgi:hypothetical protein|uniref:hypothetical protein n=1 Tax=Flavobacterium sp. NRK1 TaxID=2954929 RepID=UPI002093474D|nr:hypothetical protein [Flavobacterium sp. NRK1]MCO6149289.1 hypothetical protein [Flavobacterium sp. NRK1]